MDIFNSIEEAETSFCDKSTSSYVCIGNFDGCHIGHQKLVSSIVSSAKENNQHTCILTFDPSPKVFFDPSQKDRQLFSADQKIAAFKELGIDSVIFQPFTEQFSTLTAYQFAETLKKLNCSKVYVGSDFRFGRGRKGNIDFLKRFQNWFSVVALDIETSDGIAISSTEIRSRLQSGDVKSVSKLIGRPYELRGHIEKGRQIGRSISFPTVNLRPNQMLPMPGVYCGYINLKQNSILNPDFDAGFKAVFNIGVRPTVSETGNLTVEGHALSKDWPTEDLYGHQACFYIVAFLRAERRFDCLDDLKMQISRDCEIAQSILL